MMKRLQRVAIVNQTVHWFVVGLLTPVLALLQIGKGLSLAHVGLNLALYAGAVVILELPTGGLADTIGRKRVYLLSVAVQIVGFLVVAVSVHPVMVGVGFVLMGSARALSSGSMEAHFVDEFRRLAPDGDLQLFLARIGIWVPLGLAAGGFVGGYVPDVLGPILTGRILVDRYSANLLVGAVVGVVQLVVTAVLIHEAPRPVDGASAGPGFHRLRNVFVTSFHVGLRNPLVLVLLLSAATWGIGFAGLETFWQPQVNVIRGANPGGGTAIFGYLTTGYFLAGAVGSAVAAALTRWTRHHLEATVAVIRVLAGVGFVVLAQQTTLPGFAVVYVVVFSFNGLMSAPDDTLFNDAVPAANRSTLLSCRSLFLQGGGAISNVLMGAIAQRFSIAVVFVIGGVVLAASAGLYAVAARRRRAAEAPAG